MSRIIAGSLAARRIATPPGDRTRPTTNQVREAVFALLAARLGPGQVEPAEQLAGLKFLDLFAGSGAVGFEAISRGAEVTWVEKDEAATIKKNIAALEVSGRLMAMDVVRFLRRKPEGFDIIWMDPPYETPTALLDRIIGSLGSKGWVRQGGFVLVERSTHTSTVEFPRCFSTGRPRRYGDTIIHYGEKVSA